MRTSITNTSGEDRHFGYIPPHGKDLDDNEEIVIDGDLRTMLAGGMGRYNRKREITGLDADVTTGAVAVADAPGPSSSSSSSVSSSSSSSP